VSRLHIVHRTVFGYENPVAASYNEARMRPANLAGQRVLESTVQVQPMTWSTDYRDYWGTIVTAFEVLVPHSELAITAESRVEIAPPRPAAAACSWDALTRDDVADGLSEFLAVTATTEPDADLVDLARAASSGRDPSAAALAICDAVRSEMEYVPGATGTHTRASEAWAERKGVCQDLAHLASGALRAVGIPARYVSGYLHPATDSSMLGETVTGESHAWIEWWSGEWQGYDLTNSIGVGEHHVIVARGREYGDVTPLSGVFAGGAASIQRVEVQITQEA
jgi:transglutaminase-like putative cysteine protease